MRICEISGKRTITGNRVSHSKRATKRIWKPNLQNITIIVDGKKKRMKVCAKYVKQIKKAQ